MILWIAIGIIVMLLLLCARPIRDGFQLKRQARYILISAPTIVDISQLRVMSGQTNLVDGKKVTGSVQDTWEVDLGKPYSIDEITFENVEDEKGSKAWQIALLGADRLPVAEPLLFTGTLKEIFKFDGKTLVEVDCSTVGNSDFPPPKCQQEMWVEAGCTTDVRTMDASKVYTTQAKSVVATNMQSRAKSTKFDDLRACYGSDETKWPNAKYKWQSGTGIDYPGNDIKYIANSSAYDCKSACAETKNCVGALFAEKDGSCWLKSNLTDMTPNDDRTIYVQEGTTIPKIPGKVKYIKLSNPGMTNTCLQIAGLEVYDEFGDKCTLNVIPFGKGTPPIVTGDTYQKRYDSRFQDGKNDEAIQNLPIYNTGPREYPSIYHGLCDGNESYSVEISEPVNVWKIVYHNRKDCCQFRAAGMKMELYDLNRQIKTTVHKNANGTNSFTGDLTQTFEFPLKNGPPRKTSILGKTYHGYDLTSGIKTNSQQQCREICSKNPQCVGADFWSGPGPNFGLCWQKYDINPSPASHSEVTFLHPPDAKFPQPPACKFGTPPDKVAGWNYKGCFKDCSQGRGLPNRLPNVTSIEQCVKQAKAYGFKTAGNQYFGECWAGNNTDWNKMGDAGCCEPLGGGCTQQIYSAE